MDNPPAEIGTPRNHAGPAPRQETEETLDAVVGARGGDLEASEVQVDAGDTPTSERDEEVDEILAAADERDKRAEIRDQEADEREQVASLHSFLHDPDCDASLKARRAAAADRSQSKSDRSEGATDRLRLSDRPPKGFDEESNS